MQIIFHIDLNAFYASAEVSVDPTLEGKPLVISGNSRRAIVSTASYEARKYGIHSAMPLFQAKQLCKNLVIKPVNFTLYRNLSQSFFEIIRSYSSILEVASIDECYVDLSDYFSKHPSNPVLLAKQIQNEVYEQLKLKCSIGIAPNKFMAKMASDMKKPMGITVLNRHNYKELMWPLDISDMFGVGKKTAPRLKEVGILTIGDVANYDNYNKLRQIIGKNALLLYRKANGIDTSKVNYQKGELKSVWHSTTLQFDTADVVVLNDTLKELTMKVSKRAKDKNLISNSIGITLKYSRFETVSRQTLINEYTNEYETIISTVKYLFDNNFDGRPVRLLGVSLNNTINQTKYLKQMNLFEDIKHKSSNNHIEDFIKNVNHKSNYKLMTAAQLLNKKE